MGKLVIVDHMPEAIDINIESLVKKEISKHGEAHMIMFCRKQLKLDLSCYLAENYYYTIVIQESCISIIIQRPNLKTNIAFALRVHSMHFE